MWSVAGIVVVLVGGIFGCNPQCNRPTVDEGSESKVFKDDTHFTAKLFEIVNSICQESGGCNHTVSLKEAPGLGAGNITFEYDGITMEANSSVEFKKFKEGTVTGTVPVSYTNMTILLDDPPQRIPVSKNLFRYTVLLKLPDPQNSQCLFKWNHIEVVDFQIDTADAVNAISPKLDFLTSKDKLSQILNSKEFIDYLNREVSICNENSFLHQVTAAMVLVTVITALGSALSDTLVSLMC